MRSLLLLALLWLTTGFRLCGQVDVGWWNNKHQWDGTTHWRHYNSEGYAYGDIYFGTRFYLWHKKEAAPDVTVGAYFRTAFRRKAQCSQAYGYPGLLFQCGVQQNIYARGSADQGNHPFSQPRMLCLAGNAR